jgi:hypothetical protein
VDGFHPVDVRGEVSTSIWSTCSNESPFVSETKKYVKSTERQVVEPQMKNTFGPRLSLSAETK